MNRYKKYKDSGIAWIGEIPEGWSVRRIKFCVQKTFAGVWGDDAKGDDNDVRCYRVADFDYEKRTLSNKNPTNRNIDKATFQNREVSCGDILLEKSGGGDKTPVGRAVIVNFNTKAICSNFVHCIKPDIDTNSKFLQYIFNYMYSKKINGLYYSQTTGIQNLNVSEYLNNPYCYPALAEQEVIAEFLDRKCEEIDQLIAIKREKIEQLKEYKKSVIFEYVTGKKRVN
ncbi:MAG: restriction endonuclease subunit S [Rikenellaceae bacterium]